MRLNALLAVFAVGAPAVLAFVVPSRNNAFQSSLRMAEEPSSFNIFRREKIRQQIQQEISDVEAERARIEKQIADAEAQRKTLQQLAEAERAQLQKQIADAEAQRKTLQQQAEAERARIQKQIADAEQQAEAERARIQKQIADAEAQRETLQQQAATADAEVAARLKKLESLEAGARIGIIDLVGRGPLFFAGGVGALAAGRAVLAQREKVLEEERAKAEADLVAIEAKQAQTSSIGLGASAGIAGLGLLFANLMGTGTPAPTSSNSTDTGVSTSSVVIPRKVSVPSVRSSQLDSSNVTPPVEKSRKLDQTQTTIKKPDSSEASYSTLLKKLDAATKEPDLSAASVTTLLQKVDEPTEKPVTKVAEEPKPVTKVAEEPKPVSKVAEEPKPVAKVAEEPKPVAKVAEEPKPVTKVAEEPVTPKAVVTSVEKPSKSEVSGMNLPAPALAGVGLAFAAALAAITGSEGGQGSVSGASKSRKGSAASSSGDYLSKLGGGTPVKKAPARGKPKVATKTMGGYLDNMSIAAPASSWSAPAPSPVTPATTSALAPPVTPATTSAPAPPVTPATASGPAPPAGDNYLSALGGGAPVKKAPARGKPKVATKTMGGYLDNMSIAAPASSWSAPAPSPVTPATTSAPAPPVSPATTSGPAPPAGGDYLSALGGGAPAKKAPARGKPKFATKSMGGYLDNMSIAAPASSWSAPAPSPVTPATTSAPALAVTPATPSGPAPPVTPATASGPTPPAGGNYLSALGGGAPVKKAPARGKPKVATKTMGGYLDDMSIAAPASSWSMPAPSPVTPATTSGPATPVTPATTSAPTPSAGGDYLSALGGGAPVKKAPARGKPKVAANSMGGYLDNMSIAAPASSWSAPAPSPVTPATTSAPAPPVSPATTSGPTTPPIEVIERLKRELEQFLSD